MIIERIQGYQPELFIGKTSTRTSAGVMYRKINEETIQNNKVDRVLQAKVEYIFNDGDANLVPSGDRLTHHGKMYNKVNCNDHLREMLISHDSSAAILAYDLLKNNFQKLGGHILIQ